LTFVSDRLSDSPHPVPSISVGYWLPKLSSCRLSFIQSIFEDEKKALLTVHIKMLNVT